MRGIFSQCYPNPVEIEELTKIYYPDKTVLKDINLTIVEGESIGILGNNGAGKTTLLRLLATLLYPSAGSILIYGLDTRFESTEVKKLIGYLPERFSFYPYYSVEDILEFFEKLVSRNRKDQESIRESIITLLGIEDYLEERISNLSKGMLHKVGLAITLTHNPSIILLDEPTSGLDPLIRKNVRTILQSLSQDPEKTVIISSHILEDVEAICDRVFFLEAGEMLHDPFWISDLKKKMLQMERLEVQGVISKNIVRLIEDLDNIVGSNVTKGRIEFYCQKKDHAKLEKQLTEEINRKFIITTHPITLEDIYIMNHSGTDWIQGLN